MRLLLAALLLASITAHAEQQRQAKPSQRHTQAQQTPAAPCDQITVNNLCSPANQQEGEAKQTRPAPESRPFLTTGEAVNAFLTLGLIIFSGLAWLTVRRQANIMERTLRLQESAFGQYLTLNDWEVTRDRQVGSEFTVAFKVLNATQIPLRLDLMIFYSGEQRYDESLNSILVPDSPRGLTAPIKLGEDGLANWRAELPVAFTFRCCICFTDGLKRQWTQCFERVLGVSPIIGQPCEVQELRTTLERSTDEIQASGSNQQ